MSFKSLFIKSEEKQEVNNSNPQQQQQQIPIKEVVYKESGNVVEGIQTEKYSQQTPINSDDTIINKLWDSVIQANRPDPDYLELKNNVDALDDLPISGEQKFLSAFKVLKKTYPNFHKDDILKAIDFYEKIVLEEKEKGLSELQSLMNEKVHSVESEIKTMEVQLDDLKKQYDMLQSTIASKQIEVTKAKSDLEMKSKMFSSSVESVIKVLRGDKENIMSINF